MSEESFTEITHQSWGGRIVRSIKGIFVGFILIAISVGLLFWNEGRAVKTAKSLDEGSKSVVSISSNKIDPANEAKLVHLIGVASTRVERPSQSNPSPISCKVAIRILTEPFCTFLTISNRLSVGICPVRRTALICCS